MRDTIAAISTPRAPGGIAVIRISGADAVKTASRVFRCARGPLEAAGPNTALYGKIYDSGLLLDEAVALVFHAPKSYTGEDVVELSCHGGVYLAARVLRAVEKAGARPARPGEFTQRAFENGKMDLTEAESVMRLIGAQSEQGLRAAAAALEGALAKRIGDVKERLLAAAAAVAAYIDFPEDDVPALSLAALRADLADAAGRLSALLSEYDSGRLLTEGVRTVIAGRPNVGKSALMNLLSGYERSIVTEYAGTTRDVVSEQVRIGDLLLNLSDTAGIRETDDLIESMGVERARRELGAAELILAVFDAGEPLADSDLALLGECKNRPAVGIVNKTDLPDRRIDEALVGVQIPFVAMSAKTGEGLDALAEKIAEVLSLREIDLSAGVLANERQYSCVLRASQAVSEAVSALAGGFTPDVAGVLIDDALAALFELTGERVTDKVVEEIFSRFCVGK